MLPDKTNLTGNPTAGQYKTALGEFYDHVANLHFWREGRTVAVGDICFLPGVLGYKVSECTTPGVTGTAEPAWPAVGATVADGTAVWKMRDFRNSDSVGGVLPSNIFTKDGAPPSFRNVLINGCLRNWQRGTSVTLSSEYAFLADRWAHGAAGGISGTVTVSRQYFPAGTTDVPHNPLYFIRTQGASWESGANGSLSLSQKVEGVTSLAGKTATLSFYAKASTSKTLGIQFAQVFGTTGSPSPTGVFGANMVTLDATWKKFSVTVDIPSIAGKTITENHFLFVGFYLTAKGTNSLSGTTIADLGSDYVDIAQVQLEEGSAATAFEQRPIGLELQMCQRYAEIVTFRPCGVAYSNGDNRSDTILFKTNKRVEPTITSVSGNWNISVICVTSGGSGVSLSGSLSRILPVSTTGFEFATLENAANIFAASGSGVGGVGAWGAGGYISTLADAEL